MPSEFDLIARFFTRPTHFVSLGIGDDCALLTSESGMQMAISTDMLVSGIHFFPDTDPRQLGYKSLAVNLSDLAAMGARPVAFTLAIALPDPDEKWLEAFSEGLFSLANQFQCELIGGDTTRGSLNICITVFGEIPVNHALRRDNARADDDIWVSGTLGDARAALEFLKGDASLDSPALQSALTRLQMPAPRVTLGLKLRNLAHAAIDISDGLVGDLSHILEKSRVGATVNLDALPAGHVLAGKPREFQLRCMMAGGDDYELCFTAPAAARAEIIRAAQQVDIPVTIIGKIEQETGLRFVNATGKPETFLDKSFDHFSDT